MVEDNHSLMGGSDDVFVTPGMAWPLMEQSSPALFEGDWMLISCLTLWGPVVAILYISCLHLFIVLVPHRSIL